MDKRRMGSGGRRIFCLCFSMILLTSVFAADVFAAMLADPAPMEVSSDAVIEEIGEPEEKTDDEGISEVQQPVEELSTDGAETRTSPAPEKEKLSDEELSDEELSREVQTQEGLEKAIAEGRVTFETPDSGIDTISAKGGSREDLIQTARDQVGISGRPNKFTYWYGAISGYANPYAYAWCQVFASWCGYQAGVTVPRTASCYYAGVWFMDQGLWRSRTSGYTPRMGDYIYFDWGANGGWDHVGIVYYVKDGRVYTIEGNTGDAVKAEKSYPLTSSEIIGYGTPRFAGDPARNEPPKGCFDEVIPEKGTYHVRFRGWSFDWDDLKRNVKVKLYVGGDAASGVPMFSATADFYRPDVNNAYPGCGDNHGFDVTFYVPVDRTKDLTVYAYAVDTEGVENTLLGTKVLRADKTIPKEAGEPAANIVAPVTVKKPARPNLEVISYNQIKLSWGGVANASGYELEVASDKQFQNSVLYQTSKKAKTIRVQCQSKRYARVRAYKIVENIKYYGDFSKAVSGKTNLAQTALSKVSATRTRRIAVKTGAVAGASGYQLVVSPYKSFAGMRYCRLQNGRSGSIAVLRRKSIYYVKVRAYRDLANGKRRYGPYSEVKTVRST